MLLGVCPRIPVSLPQFPDTGIKARNCRESREPRFSDLCTLFSAPFSSARDTPVSPSCVPETASFSLCDNPDSGISCGSAL